MRLLTAVTLVRLTPTRAPGGRMTENEQHRDDPRVPVGPIVEALNHWKGEGLIRAFGGSNWSWERIREANQFAAENGLTIFVHRRNRAWRAASAIS